MEVAGHNNIDLELTSNVKNVQQLLNKLIQRKTSQLEALHSKLLREVVDRFAFYSIFPSLLIFDRYCKMYGEKRRHKELIGKTPEPLWNYKTIAVNGFVR